jgi:hypothetical protein
MTIGLLQIDSPDAGVQISRAAQNLGVVRIADCNHGAFESDYLSFAA